MKQPKFGPILLAIVLFCSMLFLPSHYLYALISDKKLEDAATSLSMEMFQGIALQEKMLEDTRYLPIYGSSELSRLDVYHPSNYFKVNPNGFTPFLIGRGGTQSFVQFMNLAATADELKDKRIVFILSPQWFTAEGLDEAHFAPNFSPLQAYDLIFNTTLPPSMKEAAAQRLLSFHVVQEDTLLTAMLEGIAADNTLQQWKTRALTPIAYTYYKILERKDIFLALTAVEPRKEHIDQRLRHLSREQLHDSAEKMGEQHSRSNSFGITDHYYQKKIAPKLEELRGYKRNESYEHSPEYTDLQMILDLLHHTNTKALFVSIPVNGPWYDYAEFPKERREVYYTKIRNHVEQEGFPVADFSVHEYDKFFLKDTIHVGWEGWIYMNEAIQNFYQTN